MRFTAWLAALTVSAGVCVATAGAQGQATPTRQFAPAATVQPAPQPAPAALAQPAPTGCQNCGSGCSECERRRCRRGNFSRLVDFLTYRSESSTCCDGNCGGCRPPLYTFFTCSPGSRLTGCGDCGRGCKDPKCPKCKKCKKNRCDKCGACQDDSCSCSTCRPILGLVLRRFGCGRSCDNGCAGCQSCRKTAVTRWGTCYPVPILPPQPYPNGVGAPVGTTPAPAVPLSEVPAAPVTQTRAVAR